jgi:protein SCO1/2
MVTVLGPPPPRWGVGEEAAGMGGGSVHMWNRWSGRSLIALAVVSWLVPSLSHAAGESGDLPQIGPAPAFSLTTQEGARLALKDLRGKVVAVTFIYASCADTCPLLTAKLAGLQARLGTALGAKVFFVAITVDPERDTPEVLKRYAQAHGVNLAGWAFLTGTPAEIQQVARHYGIYAKKRPRGAVDHTFLTSLIDRKGTLRVQYLGVRFDPEELLRDLQALVQEEARS